MPHLPSRKDRSSPVLRNSVLGDSKKSRSGVTIFCSASPFSSPRITSTDSISEHWLEFASGGSCYARSSTGILVSPPALLDVGILLFHRRDRVPRCAVRRWRQFGGTRRLDALVLAVRKPRNAAGHGCAGAKIELDRRVAQARAETDSISNPGCGQRSKPG